VAHLYSMEILELKELAIKQQEQILTLQILVQTLVDELVETGVVQDETLDIRLKERVNGIKSQMNEMRNEVHKNIPFSYGPIGEA
jgi:putative ubiquitin-RnfH superfamily antitoxin RatB of RatAB toxin-antitoxin module